MNAHGQTFLTWAVVWPLITILLWAGEPWLSPLPLVLRTLVVTAVLVPLMSYVAMPMANRWLQRVNGH